jgi:glycosyltransferase involved in cell wall biosynthesis
MSKVDVVLPVRNGEATILSALSSILAQSFSHFKLIVIDDGSTDKTPSILAKVAKCDSRLQIIQGGGNGIVAALNKGISSGSAPFVARMDADDISLPDRLSIQIEEFRNRPNLVLLGTKIQWFGSKQGQPGIVIGAERCRRALGLFTPFCHPSVMMRREAFDRLDHLYDPAFEFSEDWEFFSRLSGIGEVDNIDQVLLEYRVHDGQISATNRDTQIASQAVIAKIHRQSIVGLSGPAAEFMFHLQTLCALGPRNMRQTARAIIRSWKSRDKI